MRIRISHEITHRFEPPARMLIQNLRLTPHGFDSQYVLSWRIELDMDSALKQSEDAHGNLVTTFSHHGAPVERLAVRAAGEIETSDSAGVVRGTVERMPAEMYLRESPLAHINGALRAFTIDSTAGAEDPLDAMHRLMSEVHRVMSFDPYQTDDPDSAAEAFALRRGRARDFAHIFIACARFRDVPARFVNGYRAAEEAGGEAGIAGRRRMCRRSAGSPSTRRRASAPIRITSAWRSASTPATAASSGRRTGWGETPSRA